jgi:hypothetical protein
MRHRKLRSGVNWQGAVKQKGVKQTGIIKQGLDLFLPFILNKVKYI